MFLRSIQLSVSRIAAVAGGPSYSQSKSIAGRRVVQKRAGDDVSTRRRCLSSLLVAVGPVATTTQCHHMDNTTRYPTSLSCAITQENVGYRFLSSKRNSGGSGSNSNSNSGGGGSQKQRRGGRHFAYRKNEELRQKEAKQTRKRDKQKEKQKQQQATKATSSSSSSSSDPTSTNHALEISPVTSQAVPPALLAPTGSPHVYIARMALMNNDDDDDDDEEYEDEHDEEYDEDAKDTQQEQNLSDDAKDTLPIDTMDGRPDPHEDALDVAQSLFQGYREVPRLFETHQFDHITPHSLNLEYPTHGRSEVAFLGRSNVGKSSLVNALMRRNLCKTSKSPGRTQLPYYYGLGHKKLMQQQDGGSAVINPNQVTGYLVDLPGYGFGAAPKEVVEGWQAQTQEWLLDRRDAGVLKRLFLLLDARRGKDGPSKLDETVIQWAEEAEIPFSIVLTKADRVSVPLVIRQVNDFCIRYSTRTSVRAKEQQQQQGVAGTAATTFQSPIIHVTSASNRWGINELLESIEAEFLGIDEEESDDDDDDEELE